MLKSMTSSSEQLLLKTHLTSEFVQQTFETLSISSPYEYFQSMFDMWMSLSGLDARSRLPSQHLKNQQP